MKKLLLSEITKTAQNALKYTSKTFSSLYNKMSRKVKGDVDNTLSGARSKSIEKRKNDGNIMKNSNFSGPISDIQKRIMKLKNDFSQLIDTDADRPEKASLIKKQINSALKDLELLEKKAINYAQENNSNISPVTKYIDVLSRQANQTLKEISTILPIENTLLERINSTSAQIFDALPTPKDIIKPMALASGLMLGGNALAAEPVLDDGLQSYLTYNKNGDIATMELLPRSDISIQNPSANILETPSANIIKASEAFNNASPYSLLTTNEKFVPFSKAETGFIKELQSLLIQAGEYTGEINGIYDLKIKEGLTRLIRIHTTYEGIVEGYGETSKKAVNSFLAPINNISTIQGATDSNTLNGNSIRLSTNNIATKGFARGSNRGKKYTSRIGFKDGIVTIPSSENVKFVLKQNDNLRTLIEIKNGEFLILGNQSRNDALKFIKNNFEIPKQIQNEDTISYGSTKSKPKVLPDLESEENINSLSVSSTGDTITTNAQIGETNITGSANEVGVNISSSNPNFGNISLGIAQAGDINASGKYLGNNWGAKIEHTGYNDFTSLSGAIEFNSGIFALNLQESSINGAKQKSRSLSYESPITANFTGGISYSETNISDVNLGKYLILQGGDSQGVKLFGKLWIHDNFQINAGLGYEEVIQTKLGDQEYFNQKYMNGHFGFDTKLRNGMEISFDAEYKDLAIDTSTQIQYTLNNGTSVGLKHSTVDHATMATLSIPFDTESAKDRKFKSLRQANRENPVSKVLDEQGKLATSNIEQRLVNLYKTLDSQILNATQSIGVLGNKVFTGNIYTYFPELKKVNLGQNITITNTGSQLINGSSFSIANNGDFTITPALNKGEGIVFPIHIQGEQSTDTKTVFLSGKIDTQVGGITSTNISNNIRGNASTCNFILDDADILSSSIVIDIVDPNNANAVVGSAVVAGFNPETKTGTCTFTVPDISELAFQIQATDNNNNSFDKISPNISLVYANSAYPNTTADSGGTVDQAANYAIDLTGNDTPSSDTQASSLSVTNTAVTSGNGTISLAGVYTPSAGESGTISGTYEVTNDLGLRRSENWTLEILPSVVINNQTFNLLFGESKSFTVVTSGVTSTLIASNPVGGSCTIVGNTVTFVPDSNFSGTARCDIRGGNQLGIVTDSGTVSFEVSAEFTSPDITSSAGTSSAGSANPITLTIPAGTTLTSISLPLGWSESNGVITGPAGPSSATGTYTVTNNSTAETATAALNLTINAFVPPFNQINVANPSPTFTLGTVNAIALSGVTGDGAHIESVNSSDPSIASITFSGNNITIAAIDGKKGLVNFTIVYNDSSTNSNSPTSTGSISIDTLAPIVTSSTDLVSPIDSVNKSYPDAIQVSFNKVVSSGVTFKWELPGNIPTTGSATIDYSTYKVSINTPPTGDVTLILMMKGIEYPLGGQRTLF